MDILYYDAFVRMGVKDSNLKLVTTPLYGFIRDFIMPHGRISLLLTVGEFPKTYTVMAEFFVVECPFAFNALLGSLSIKALKAITSVYHFTMKFPMLERVEIVKGS